MSVLKCNLTRIGSIVAEKFGMKNVSVTQKDSDKVIVNYFGIINPLTITGFKNEEKISKNIILKIGETNKGPQFRKVLCEVYEIETYFYRTILPVFIQVTKSNQLAPECYYIEETPDPIIVLQDMRDKGYQRYEKKSFDEIEHVIVSLKTLAKFHATSIVVKRRNIHFDAHLLKPYTPTYPVEYQDGITDSLKKNLHLFKNTPYEKFFENLLSKYDYFLHDSSFKTKCTVYGHGDFWKDNILFKYENNRPVAACLIDFQKIRTLCPAQDFLHLLSTSVESHTRREHIEVFISNYLESLHNLLNENNQNILYTRDDFTHDLKVVAPVMTAISFMSFSLWAGLDVSSFLPSKNIANVDNIQSATDEFKANIINVVEDLHYLGFIQI